MSTKVERILDQIGANMAESVGLRATPAAGDGRYNGIRLARDKGEVPIEMLTPDPDQPRKDFADLDRLAASIELTGILQPLRVRWDPALSKWKILTGERRYRAALKKGLSTVPCILLDRELTVDEVEQEQLAENFHRQDLSPVELAQAFKRRMDRRGINQSTLAAEVGIDKASVSRILSVLKLPDDVQAQVNAGEIAPSAAYEISRIPSAEKQREMAGQAAAGRLTQKAAADQARQSLPIEKHRRRTGQPLTLTYRHDAGLKITVRIEAGARRKLVENWQELAVEIEADLRQKSGRRMAA